MAAFSELNTTAAQAAKRLLGCELVRIIDGKKIRVRIVETEAYDESDPASHSFIGKRTRTEIMFGPPGHLYVYFIYGMYFCCNVVTGPDGHGEAALIRAVEPISGIETMEELRGLAGKNLSNGPGKLCRALGIDKTLNGHDLSKSPLKLIMRDPISPSQIVTTERIGITKAADKRWRFYLKDNLYVSRP
jgi:DNA-3-methyladenine glycosylase